MGWRRYIPYFQTRLDEPGAGGGHFGFSTGGVLGGFDNKSLIELGNNNYQVDYFDPVGNSIETSMSDLEKYILGLLPKEDLDQFIHLLVIQLYLINTVLRLKVKKMYFLIALMHQKKYI